MSLEDGEVSPEVVTSTDAPAEVTGESATPATPEVDKPESGNEPAEAKKKGGGFQNRINELTRRTRELERTNERLLALAEQKIKGEGKADVKSDSPPKLENFDSYEAYLDAKLEYNLEQRDKLREKQTTEEKRRQASQEAIQTFDSKADKLRVQYPDFDDVAFNDAIDVSPSMSSFLMAADRGAEMLYYLGNNPLEATRISRLNGYALVKEMVNLEDKISAAPTQQEKKPSNAPDPINPVKPNASASNSPSEKDDMDTWIKKRRAQVRGK